MVMSGDAILKRDALPKLSLEHSTRIWREGTESTPKVRIERRASDALGHSRCCLYRGITQDPLNTTAAGLCDSVSILLFQQPSSSVP